MNEPSAFSADFARHYATLRGYWIGIDAMRLQALQRPEWAFSAGVFQQWSALHRLACTEMDLLWMIASGPHATTAERVWAEHAREERAFLHDVVDGTAYALDFGRGGFQGG